MKAVEVCEKAAILLGGDRAEQNGDMWETHNRIARFWTAYLERHVTPQDVALMMVLMKLARSRGGAHNPDDYIDAAGYAAIACEVGSR